MLESQWIFDTYLSLFREVEDEYNSLNITYWQQAGSYKLKGLEAFNKIIKLGLSTTAIQDALPMFENLKEPVEELIYLINEIDKSKFAQKEFLAYKILRFYYENLKDLTTPMQHALIHHNTNKTNETFVSLANFHQTVSKLEKLFSTPIR